MIHPNTPNEIQEQADARFEAANNAWKAEVARLQRENNALTLIVTGKESDFERLVNERDDLRAQLTEQAAELTRLRAVIDADRTKRS